MSSKEACQAEACDLQECLSKHTYQPEKCDRTLRQLYECCQRFYDNAGEQETSTACPQVFVVKRWLKDHPKK